MVRRHCHQQAVRFLEHNGPVLEVVGFASMNRAVDAVIRFALAQDLCRRSVDIFPSGNEDIGDDLKAGFGGAVVCEQMREVKSVLAQELKMRQEQSGGYF